MYVTTVPNRNSNPTILIRESYRENGKVKNRTIANITRWPKEKIEALKKVLKGTPLYDAETAFNISRSLPHGHVAAVLGSLKKLNLHRIIDSHESFNRKLIIAMIVARILFPQSKLATALSINEKNAQSSLGGILEIDDLNENNLYDAMDWLLERKERIENKLAKRHLDNNSLILYDISSTYLEGTKCPLSARGHNRDKKKGKLQLVFGLLCNQEGCPVSVEVYKGNTSDATTLKSQINKIRNRFNITKIIIVGDRGMITETRIRKDLEGMEGVDWITALKSCSIKKLVDQKAFEPTLFDEWGLAEINSPDYPGERLIICINSFLREKRNRTRNELIKQTEELLEKIKKATQREKRPLQGEKEIALRIGKVINKFKMNKHFTTTVTNNSFEYEINQESVKHESLLDGFYVVRTSIESNKMNDTDVVRNYKKLAEVEKAFRIMKTTDLHLRPIYHYREKRVRSHIFLCMLSYYVEWHMRKQLTPLLYYDEYKKIVENNRETAVAPAVRSTDAKRKDQTKKTVDDEAVHSFRSLVLNLGTLTKNWIKMKVKNIGEIIKYSQPTPFQKKVFDLLGISYKM